MACRDCNWTAYLPSRENQCRISTAASSSASGLKRSKELPTLCLPAAGRHKTKSQRVGHAETSQPAKDVLTGCSGKLSPSPHSWARLQAVRVEVNYPRFFGHGTGRVELHAYPD